MTKTQTPPHAARHALVQYALVARPRPGNRETRMRETGGAWLQRSGHDEQAEETT